MIRVLIADGQYLAREGLKAIVAKKEDIQIVGEVTSSTELAAQIARSAPDLVIIDPFRDLSFTVNSISLIRERFPNVKVLICSVPRKEVIMEAISTTGNYISKYATADEFVSAIYQSVKN